MERRGFIPLLFGGSFSAAAQPSPGLREIPEQPPVPPARDEGRFAGSRWRSVWLHDDDKWAALLADFCSPSPGRAIAALRLESDYRRRSAVRLTRDGGQTWTENPLPDAPVSLFALDANHLWMVGERSLWFSAEAGYQWTKFRLPKTSRGRPVTRVHFVDPRTGWAFGAGRGFLATGDGGATWSAVPQSEAVELKDDNTVWTAMTFLDRKHGLIAGFSDPRLNDAGRLPEWMMPERASRRKIVPITTAAGETKDGGATWKFSAASAFGRPARLCSQGNRGLAIYYYSENFPFPSEVYSLDFLTGGSRPVFRRRGLWVHDAILLPDGTAVLAAIQSAGGLHSSPVPGKLRVYYSSDLEEWAEMKVDYRAEGLRAFLAAPRPDELWAATSAACILRLL